MFIPYKLRLLKWHLFRHWEGEKIIKETYASLYGKELNLAQPETFSEKLFHRMVITHRQGNPTFTKLSDKWLAREYVSSKIGNNYLANLIWHGTNPENIPFDSLPSKCVVKTNHGSGWNIILQEPYDRKEVVRKLKKWLKGNFYWSAREYHYYKIPRRILIEEFMDDGFDDGPLDYRFWCFNGLPEVIQIGNHPHSINLFYDLNWNKLPLFYRHSLAERDIPKPANLSEMLVIAAKLSCNFEFVRVDLYNLKGKIYFGELTFTPVAGHFKFNSESWDVLLGQKWLIRN